MSSEPLARMSPKTFPVAAEPLLQVRALVIEGHGLAKALNATVHPFQTYDAWSPVWSALWEAQQESPRRTLHDLDELMARDEILALVDRALSAATVDRALGEGRR